MSEYARFISGRMACILGGLVVLLFPTGVFSSPSSLDTPPCVHKEGWTHVDAKNWNACTRILHGMRRIPLDQLDHVYLDPPPGEVILREKNSETTLSGSDGHQPIVKISSGNYHGHALALVPKYMRAQGQYVLVYLHGYNHQVANGTPLTESRLEYDRFAAQINRSGHSKDLVALFPQASAENDFTQMKPNPSFDLRGFLKEASSRIHARIPLLKEPIILMAHSAGGRFLNNALSSLGAEKLRVVAFFDAINGPIELGQMQDYLQNRISDHIGWIKAHSFAAEGKQYRALLPHFYFYYSSQSSYYTKLHKQLQLSLEKGFAKWSQSLNSHQNKWLNRIRNHYRIIAVPKEVNHSDLMRSGVVERVLKTVPVLR